MTRRSLILALVAVGSFPHAATAQIQLAPNFVDETLVTGLNQPNGMAFLPDGRLLLTELETGKIRMVVNGHIAAMDPVAVADSVTFDNVERGLQGIAVDPRWPTYPYVYVCYTHIGNRMSLVRYSAGGDVSNPTGENLLLAWPRILIHDFYDNADNHNGLGLRFGLDGKLLMTTGDDADGCSAQVMGSLRGKLLRLDVTRIPSGPGGPVPRALLIPPDNPFVGPDSNASLVYATGLRNPWRFSVDAMTGAIVLGDVGEGAYEEVDEIFAGRNYGWPYREGPMIRTQGGCTEPPGSIFEPSIISLDRATGYVAVIAAGVYRPRGGGTWNWPSIYNGNFFYGDYFLSRLRRLVRSGSTWVPAAAIPGQPNSQDWATGLRFAVDFAVGPDGSLWWLKAFNDAGTASTGMLKRIRYTSTVDVPVAGVEGRVLSASPNPFHDQVDLAWRLPSPGRVTIEIFDMSGRRVRRFDQESAASGRLTWDGRDDGGAPVAAGLFLARLRHEGGSGTVRLLRLE